MAKYLAGQILLGKLEYNYVVTKWPQYKADIDAFLESRGWKPNEAGEMTAPKETVIE